MYEKPAITSTPIHDLIQRRWSPRAFTGEAVDRETMTKLLEAARWASSRFNSQPWRFIIATQDDPAGFQTLFNCLMVGNQKWAHKAGALIAVVANLISRPGADPNPAMHYDVGLAVGQLVIEAMANDLHVHQMAGIERAKIVETYGVPEGHAVICCLAIGKMGDKEELEDPFDAREVAPRERKTLDEIAFSGSWGNPY